MKAVANVGLEGLRPYDLLHSLASLLIAEHANPAEIAAQLGHTMQTLFSTYAHVIEELRGREGVTAEGEIRAIRAGKPRAGVGQKLPEAVFEPHRRAVGAKRNPA